MLLKSRGHREMTGAQAIRRAMNMVRLVAQLQQSGASLTRLAQVATLKRSTAFRILRSLTEERILSCGESDRCYRLGPLAFELGLAASAEADRRAQQVWRAVVERIATETRLTTYLMARSGHEAVCLLCTEGNAVLRAMPVSVGQRLPLGVGAGSLAILASLPDEEVRRVVSLNRATMGHSGRAVKVHHVLRRVALTRKHGYAASAGSVTEGVIGVGVAIPRCEDMPALALSVSAVARTISGKAAKDLACVLRSSMQHQARHAPKVAGQDSHGRGSSATRSAPGPDGRDFAEPYSLARRHRTT
jgi:DNA-binding IclR family transcriptional regulator